MRCQHQPGLISINGMYECPLCFQQVRHPLAPASELIAKTDKLAKLAITETGIERMARERESDWMREMGVKA